MAKKLNGNNQYIQELKQAIKERTGEPCPMWLMPMVRATAMNMIMLERLQDEIMKEKDLLRIEGGSMGQIKNVAHPLLVAYKEAQRTVSLQFEKLGLTYSATPSKITETTKKGVEETDPMKIMLDTMGGI